MKEIENINMGKFTYCLGTDAFQREIEHYTKLGFEEYGGNIHHGWKILKNANMEFGIFKHFEGPLMNFRGGDIAKLFEYYTSKSFEIKNGLVHGEDGSLSFTLIDPNGIPILFDTHPTEKEILNNLGKYDLQKWRKENTPTIGLLYKTEDLNSLTEYYQELVFSSPVSETSELKIFEYNNLICVFEETKDDTEISMITNIDELLKEPTTKIIQI